MKTIRVEMKTKRSLACGLTDQGWAMRLHRLCSGFRLEEGMMNLSPCQCECHDPLVDSEWPNGAWRYLITEAQRVLSEA